MMEMAAAMKSFFGGFDLPAYEKDYSSILGIPVAGASLPIIAFLLLSIYGRNPLLGIATVILGIGHIGIHLMHARECNHS